MRTPFVGTADRRQIPKKTVTLQGEGGGRTWARTKDPLIKSQLLYQLSYASTPACLVKAAPSITLAIRRREAVT